MRALRLLSLASVCTIALLSDANADWPTGRHDSKRTGAAIGSSNLTKPVPYWRAYLGGTLDAGQLMPIDVNKDGTFDIVYVSGGSVHASAPTGESIWSSPARGVTSLTSVDDLDGDGTLDVVAASRDQVFVFNGKSGVQEWAEVAGEMGTIGGVRVGDLDHDAKPDLLVQECGCCQVNSGKSGFAYSFGSGFAAPKKLWTLPAAACAGARAMVLVDVDGDGALEATNGSSAGRISILEGPTGAILATGPDLGPYGDASLCLPAEVDGVDGEELVCAQSIVGATSAHRIFMLHFAGGATPSLTQVWNKDVGVVDRALILTPDFVLDVDGDTKKEVVVSGRTSPGSTSYSTFIYDAATGALLATIADQRAVGTAPIESATKNAIITTAGGMLSAYTFERPGTTTVRWTLPGQTAATQVDWTRSRRSILRTRTLATDVSGDGIVDLLAYRGIPADHLGAYSAAGGVLKSLGEYALPATPLEVTLAPSVSGFAPIVVARDDGVLSVLNDKLVSVNEAKGGLRFGGYYASGGWRELDISPVVAALGDDAAQSVLIPNSSGTLLRLDAKGSTNVAPPIPTWKRRFSSTPAIVAKAVSGKPGIACIATVEPVTDPAVSEIVMLKADGTNFWASPMESPPVTDVVAGDINGDGVGDVAIQWSTDSDTTLHTRAFDGTSGAVLWNNGTVIPASGLEPSGFALTDWNGDGKSDVLFQGGATRVLSGANGLEVASGGPTDGYYMPTAIDIDGDGVDEVVLHGGFNAVRALKHDLTSLWVGADSDNPYPYAAVAQCSGKGPILVGGSLQNPSRLKMTVMSGTSAGTFTTVVLAGGAVYTNEIAATAAGAALGQLTATNVHTNLSGTAIPTAVLGSFDGWLYGIDPCTGTLAFTYHFNAPVGEPVFGDTDGDGNDEIIVSAGDGYLYGLKQETIPAPGFVWDVDPAKGLTGADIDSTTTTDSLSGKWVAVPGAEKYEVAAVGPDGKYLTTPPWIDVGNVTIATIPKLALTDGAKYLFGVRAITSSKTGPDAVSNGVTIVVDAGDAGFDGDNGLDSGADAFINDAGASTDVLEAGNGQPGAEDDSAGCGCSTTVGRGFASPASGLLAAIAVLTQRRRRQRR